MSERWWYDGSFGGGWDLFEGERFISYVDEQDTAERIVNAMNGEGSDE